MAEDQPLEEIGSGEIDMYFVRRSKTRTYTIFSFRNIHCYIWQWKGQFWDYGPPKINFKM